MSYTLFDHACLSGKHGDGSKITGMEAGQTSQAWRQVKRHKHVAALPVALSMGQYNLPNDLCLSACCKRLLQTP